MEGSGDLETAAQRKLPKIKTIRKWKETYAWLDLVKHTTNGNTQMKMTRVLHGLVPLINMQKLHF